MLAVTHIRIDEAPHLPQQRAGVHAGIVTVTAFAGSASTCPSIVNFASLVMAPLSPCDCFHDLEKLPLSVGEAVSCSICWLMQFWCLTVTIWQSLRCPCSGKSQFNGDDAMTALLLPAS